MGQTWEWLCPSGLQVSCSCSQNVGWGRRSFEGFTGAGDCFQDGWPTWLLAGGLPRAAWVLSQHGSWLPFFLESTARRELQMPFTNWSQKLHEISFPIVYSLEVSCQLQPTPKGRGIRLHLWKSISELVDRFQSHCHKTHKWCSELLDWLLLTCKSGNVGASEVSKNEWAGSLFSKD